MLSAARRCRQVIFARREYPGGIAAIVSDSDGETWSDAEIIRDDASGSDLGYPCAPPPPEPLYDLQLPSPELLCTSGLGRVATELDDGRVFCAYYFQLEDGNKFGGTRFIGGSILTLA